MSTEPTCPSWDADLPADRAPCARCGDVRCWDCGSANGAEQAFCRRCGVWLVGRDQSSDAAPGPTLRPTVGIVTALPPSRPVAPPPVATRSIVATPLRFETAPRGRGRWVVLSLAAAVVLATVAAVGALELRGPESVPPAIAAVAPSLESPNVGPTPASTALSYEAAPPPSPPPPASEPPVSAPQARVAALADVGGADMPSVRTLGQRAPRTRSGWVCDDSVRLADATGRRWVVDRVSFRALGGLERIILHLDQDGSASVQATAFGASMASSGVRGSSQARTRPARRGIGIELAGGIRSGLELRAYRPQGLRTIRELSIYRSGPESRILISVASDGCFRMRAPAWQQGASAGGAAAQLIVDVRR